MYDLDNVRLRSSPPPALKVAVKPYTASEIDYWASITGYIEDAAFVEEDAEDAIFVAFQGGLNNLELS